MRVFDDDEQRTAVPASESQGNSDVHIRFQLKIPNPGKSASDRHARPWSRLEAVVEPFDPKRKRFAADVALDDVADSLRRISVDSDRRGTRYFNSRRYTHNLYYVNYRGNRFSCDNLSHPLPPLKCLKGMHQTDQGDGHESEVANAESTGNGFPVTWRGVCAGVVDHSAGCCTARGSRFQCHHCPAWCADAGR